MSQILVFSYESIHVKINSSHESTGHVVTGELDTCGQVDICVQQKL